MAGPEFSKFLAVLRSGERDSIEELLRQLDPFLRQAIRLRLIDSRLRRVVDTTDILQSLLKDFLSQKQNNRPDGASGGLCAYLAAAVRNKVRMRMRKERRQPSSLPEEWELVSPEGSPARQVAAEDQCEAIRARLPEEARVLFDLRLQGFTWRQIAQQVGGTSNVLRVRLSRAIARIARELDCEE